MRIGEARLRSGAARDAIVALDKAIELDPKLAQAYALAGEALEQLADLRAATVYYRRAVKEIPESAELQFKLGVTELQTAGHRRAATALNRAVILAEEQEELPQWLPEALYRLGTTQRALGRRQAAIDAFKRYLEIAPEDAIDRAEVQAHLDLLGAV
jgi:tetratricopeptide (TPR) repeat protein